MTTIQPLEALGYDPDMFKLSNPGDETEKFIYYTFDDTSPPALANDWNIIGLRRRFKETLLLDVSVMYVGDDELSLKEFSPEYAASFLDLSRIQVQALITWLERSISSSSPETAQSTQTKYFRPLQISELGDIRLDSWEIQHAGDNYYYYLPDENVQSAQKVSVICFPIWKSERGVQRTDLLRFATFDHHLLHSSEFRPFDADKWLGYMTFSEETLQEFILLLRKFA